MAVIEVLAELILDPRVHFGTFEAGVHETLATHLSALQSTLVGMIAGDKRGINFFLALPRLEIVDLRQRCWRAHPFDGLVICHKVDILLLEKLIHESLEDAEIVFLFEPSGMEIDSKRCFVGVIMPLEVFHEHFKDLFVIEMCGTRVDHTASMAIDVQRVHDHLPHARE